MNKSFGEPQLSKYNLYEAISKVGSTASGVKYLDIMNLMDGSRDLIEISIRLNRSIIEIAQDVNILKQFNLIKEKI